MDSGEVNLNGAAVQSYLNMLQAVITRVANNSAACKTWCISLLSAIMVLSADKSRADLVWIGGIPVLLFFVLDAYYLGLERQFRDIFGAFIRKLHFGNAACDDLFMMAPRAGRGVTSLQIARAAASMSVWPFYSLLAVLIVIVRNWLGLAGGNASLV